jgi:ABC-type multidrug transport system fused ATPase/permease subunit
VTALRTRALVLAAALPLLFLHVQYQPGIVVHAGSTSVHAYLSDFAVLAVVVAALVSGVVDGWAPLRAGRPLWIAGVLFFAWVLVEVAWGRHVSSTGYAWHDHAVTAAKFFEYALLAPAVPLLLRETRDLVAVAWSLVAWNALATIVGIAEFFGAAIFMADGHGGVRQSSFLGSSDWAALAGGVLLVGVLGLALPRLRVGRTLTTIAVASGIVGMVIAGALASVIGLATALVVLGIVLVLRSELDRRRVAAVAVAALAVLAGTVAIRSSDLNAFRSFVDSAPASTQSSVDRTPSYAHRTLLAWLGYEVWKGRPLLGSGWEGTTEPAVFDPYLPAAHRRFPNVTPLAFPSASRRYGVQDAWIEAAADLGVVGLALWAALFATAAWPAARLARTSGTGTALYALAGLGFLVWLWAAQGFYAGIPLDAFTWLVFGVAALGELGQGRATPSGRLNSSP